MILLEAYHPIIMPNIIISYNVLAAFDILEQLFIICIGIKSRTLSFNCNIILISTQSFATMLILYLQGILMLNGLKFNEI